MCTTRLLFHTCTSVFRFSHITRITPRSLSANSRQMNTSSGQKMVEGKEHHKLHRQIGLLESIGIFCGLVIGAGIFVSPQAVIRHANSVSTSLVLWTLGGALSACGALCFAELGTTFPTSGEKYEYLYVMFGRKVGPFLAFLYCWSQIGLFRAGANAIKCLTFANYLLKPLYPDCPIPARGVILVGITLTCKSHLTICVTRGRIMNAGVWLGSTSS